MPEETATDKAKEDPEQLQPAGPSGMERLEALLEVAETLSERLVQSTEALSTMKIRVNPSDVRDALFDAVDLLPLRMKSSNGLARSEQIGQLAAALAKAQGAMTNPARTQTAKVSETRSFQYADLGSVINALRTPLSNNGLTYIQGAETVWEGDTIKQVVVTTELIHAESGQWCRNTLALEPLKRVQGGFARSNDQQTVGLTQTYARRYALLAITGLAAEAEDDDTNGHTPARAQGQTTRRPARRAPTAEAPTSGARRPRQPRKMARSLRENIERLLDKHNVTLESMLLAAAIEDELQQLDVLSINDLTGPDGKKVYDLLMALDAETLAEPTPEMATDEQWDVLREITGSMDQDDIMNAMFGWADGGAPNRTPESLLFAEAAERIKRG